MAVLTLVSLALRAWVGYAGWFSLDDYVFATRAHELPLASAELLLTPYNGHLMPGSMVWVWALTALDPLGFELVVTVSLVLQLLVHLAFLWLLRALAGWRPAILLPYAFFTLTTMTLPGGVWWAAALNQLPQQLFTILALVAQVRLVRSGRRWWALGVVAAVAAGLAFSEKTALAVPLLLLVTWWLLVDGPMWPALRKTLRVAWPAWAGLAALFAAYVPFYLTRVPSLAKEGATAGQLVETVVTMTRSAVLPGMLGGPWRWAPWGEADALAAPPGAAQMVAAAVVGGLVVIACLRSGFARRAWMIVALALLVEAVLIWATRVPVVGIRPVATEYRYVTDLALVIGVAVLVSVVRWRPPVRGPGGQTTPEPRAAERVDTHLATLTRDVHLPTVAGCAVVLLAVSAGWSAATFRERWAGNPGREWFANARHDLATAGPDAVVYDGPVPTRVIWRLLWPATLPSQTLPMSGSRYRPLQEGMVTDRLLDLDQQGRLRESRVSGIALRVDAPGECLPIGPAPVRVPLDTAAFAWSWVLQLDYTATGRGELSIAVGNADVTTPVAPGERRAYVAAGEAIDQVTLSAPASAGVCLRSGTVGLPQPVEW